MAWIRSNKKGSGGGSTTLPSIISTQSLNAGGGATISYTFTEAGIYQYYATAKSGETAITFTVKLNNDTLTPSFYEVTSGPYIYYRYYYGEVTVSANDVISVIPSAGTTHGGNQLHILQDANISAFSYLGSVGNDGSTFDIVNDGIALEVYFQGYYNGTNNCRSHLIAGNASPCTIFNNTADFYWGGTYALKVQ